MTVEEIKNSCKEVYDKNKSTDELVNYINGEMPYGDFRSLGEDLLPDAKGQSIPLFSFIKKEELDLDGGFPNVSSWIAKQLVNEWNK